MSVFKLAQRFRDKSIMTTNRRTARVNHLLREEISNLLVRHVKDPRLAAFVSIIEVKVTPDLRLARVFVSVMGSEEEKKSVLAGLRSAANFMRRELEAVINMRSIPQLTFFLDDSIERGARILTTLNQIATETPGEQEPS